MNIPRLLPLIQVYRWNNWSIVIQSSIHGVDDLVGGVCC